MLIWVKAILLTAVLCLLWPAFAVLQIMILPFLIFAGVLFFIWFILKMIQEDESPKT